MKSMIFSIIALVVSGLMLFASLTSKTDTDVNEEITLNKLKEIENSFHESFYESLFSISELKSISIISVNKIASMYDNKWISPATANEMLNLDDKRSLLHSTKDFLETIPNNDTKKVLIQKVRRWCIAHFQVEMLSDKMRISRESIIKALSELPGTDSLIVQYSENQNQGESFINSLDYPQVYFESINYLSQLSGREQMNFFSKLYDKLSSKVNY